MRRELTGDDRIVLERLQTELARRCDGAVDFWTMVCLSSEIAGPVRQGFVTDHVEVVRSLAVVLRALLVGLGVTEGEPVADHLNRVFSSCEEFVNAFTILEQSPQVRLEEIRTATRVLAQSHSQLVLSLQALGMVLGCPASYWQSRTPERAAYYQGILDRLFDTFCQAKSSTAHPVGV